MSLASRTIVCALGAGAVLACAASPIHARELSPTQRNVIEHFSQAQVGTEVCDSYRLNVRLVGLLAFGAGLPLGSQDFKDAVAARTSFHRARIAGRTRDDICAAALRLFGPSGSDVKNLILPK